MVFCTIFCVSPTVLELTPDACSDGLAQHMFSIQLQKHFEGDVTHMLSMQLPRVTI
jgi:hypothetical protein